MVTACSEYACQTNVTGPKPVADPGEGGGGSRGGWWRWGRRITCSFNWQVVKSLPLPDMNTPFLAEHINPEGL